MRIPNPNAPAQRHFDERRARPLSRSHRPCASDEARASRRPILVSGVRPAHFVRGPSLAPLVPGPLSRGILVVDQGDRRPAAAGRDARAPAASRTTRARASYRRRAFADLRLGQAQLRPLSARHRAADRPRRKVGRSDADLEPKAVAARSDRPARGRHRALSARSGRGRSFSNMRSPRTGSRASAARTRIPKTAKRSHGFSPTCESMRPRRGRRRACSSAAARQTAETSPIGRR